MSKASGELQSRVRRRLFEDDSNKNGEHKNVSKNVFEVDEKDHIVAEFLDLCDAEEHDDDSPRNLDLTPGEESMKKQDELVSFFSSLITYMFLQNIKNKTLLCVKSYLFMLDYSTFSILFEACGVFPKTIDV